MSNEPSLNTRPPTIDTMALPRVDTDTIVIGIRESDGWSSHALTLDGADELVTQIRDAVRQQRRIKATDLLRITTTELDGIIDTARTAGRDLTDGEVKTVDALIAKVKDAARDIEWLSR